MALVFGGYAGGGAAYELAPLAKSPQPTMASSLGGLSTATDNMRTELSTRPGHPPSDAVPLLYDRHLTQVSVSTVGERNRSVVLAFGLLFDAYTTRSKDDAAHAGDLKSTYMRGGRTISLLLLSPDPDAESADCVQARAPQSTVRLPSPTSLAPNPAPTPPIGHTGG